MYDKTTGGLHRIYSFVGTGSWSKVYDALPVEARDEIDDLVNDDGDGFPQYTPNPPLCDPATSVTRMVVDGYLRTLDSVLQVSTQADGSVFESVPACEIYPVPVIDWINHTYVKAVSGQKVTVRIFFS